MNVQFHSTGVQCKDDPMSLNVKEAETVHFC